MTHIYYKRWHSTHKGCKKNIKQYRYTFYRFNGNMRENFWRILMTWTHFTYWSVKILLRISLTDRLLIVTKLTSTGRGMTFILVTIKCKEPILLIHFLYIYFSYWLHNFQLRWCNVNKTRTGSGGKSESITLSSASVNFIYYIKIILSMFSPFWCNVDISCYSSIYVYQNYTTQICHDHYLLPGWYSSILQKQ